jgi:hypothetical protein
LHAVEAIGKAFRLPVTDTLDEYRSTLQAILNSPSDDCVRILAGEGKSFQETREKVRKIREATSDEKLKILDRARTALGQMWPIIEQRVQDSAVGPQAAQLREDIEKSNFYEYWSQIVSATEAIERAYRTLYEQGHEERRKAFGQAIEEVKGRPEWAAVPAEIQTPTLAPLTSRTCDALDLPENTVVCRKCSATISQMESELEAVTSLRGQVLRRLQELTAPQEKVERVRVAELFTEPLDSEESLNEVLDRLRDHLQKLIAAGVKVILE